MEPTRAAWRRAAAIATVTIFAAACLGIGLVVGLGLWLAAALGGALVGALAMLAAVGTPSAPRAAGSSRDLDAVSGLPDSARLTDDLEALLTDDQSDGGVLHFCVLHGIGQYNDAYGEACGDAMIGWLARKLSDAVGESSTVYRMRGAAFAVLSPLTDRMETLRSECAGALLEVGEGFAIRGAIGRAVLPGEANTASAAVELATRRALAERRERPDDTELRPPRSPMEVIPLVRPRYQIAEVAARIGRRMGLGGSELEELEAAAHLRDVGNMALPNAVLTRTGELPAHEWELFRLHTLVGERLLAANFGMESVAKLVRSSHERWDGAGYPDELEGTEIPLGARILFVCGAFQDMTSKRPHRSALTAPEALAELRLGAGTQFDPDVVRAFQDEFAAPDADAAPQRGGAARTTLDVLVADDDAASRFLLARAIDAAGHRCTIVEDGMSAWRAFRRVRPDVVICDSHLPRINAERLCRRIRSEEAERQTYFVTLVTLQENERIQRDLEHGADDFLAKPFDREDLETLLAVAVNEVSLRRDPQ